jgi:hypothetical protein
MRSSRGDGNLLSRRDFFERKGLWNVMGLHYTVNNSTSKKFLALGSVKKRLTLCDGGVRTRTVAVLVLLFSTSSAMYYTSSLV